MTEQLTITLPVDLSAITDPAAALASLDAQLAPVLKLRERLHVLASADAQMAHIRESVAAALGQAPPKPPVVEPEPPVPEPPVLELMPPPAPEGGQS